MRRGGRAANPLVLSDGAVHVWTVRTRADVDPLRRVLDRYRRPEDGHPFVVRDGRKPRLVAGWGGDVRFNVSRAGRFMLLAVTRGREVGIDVEELGRDRWLSLPGQVLTPAERDAVEALPAHARGDAFLRLWVRKEAVLKAAGTGLAVDPSMVSVGGPADPPAVLGLPAALGPVTRFRLVDLPLRRYTAAVAVERSRTPVTAAIPPVLTKSLRLRDLAITPAE